MRFFLCGIAVAIGFLFTPGAFAQNDRKTITFLRVTDSLKDTEARIAKILLEKMNINSSLQVRGNNTEDLVLRVRINENKEKNLPTVAAVIDTKILNRNKDNKATSQLINIASFADIKIKEDKKLEVLEWANKWNSQQIPMRIYVAGDRIIAARHLFNSHSAPLPENAVTGAFTGVLRAWGTLLTDLRKNDLIEQ